MTEKSKKKKAWSKSHELQSNRLDVHYWRPDAEIAFLYVIHPLEFDSRNLVLGKSSNAERKSLIRFFGDREAIMKFCFIRTVIRCRIKEQREMNEKQQQSIKTYDHQCKCFAIYGWMVGI